MDASDWLELALCCIESCPFRPSDDPGDTEEALAAFLGPWLERHTPPDVLQGILELERPRRLHALWTWWQHEAFLPLMQIDYLAGRPYNERGDCEPAMTLRRFASPIKGDDGHFVRKLLAGDYKKFPKGKARRPELANAEKSASILAYQAGQRNGGFPHDAD